MALIFAVILYMPLSKRNASDSEKLETTHPSVWYTYSSIRFSFKLFRCSTRILHMPNRTYLKNPHFLLMLL